MIRYKKERIVNVRGKNNLDENTGRFKGNKKSS